MLKSGARHKINFMGQASIALKTVIKESSYSAYFTIKKIRI